MKALVAAVALLAIASNVQAQERLWQFHPGQSYTYEFESKLTYSVDKNKTSGSHAEEGKESGETEEHGGCDCCGGGDGRGRGEDKGHYAYVQTETLSVTAIVMTVGDNGGARLQLTVNSVKIDSHFQTTGEHPVWDSAKSKTPQLAGLLKYEPLLGATFEVVVGPDGTIQDSKGAEWGSPKAATFKGKEREELAASLTHNPTPLMTWLELLFTTVPTGGKETPRKLNLVEEQSFTLKPDGSEATGNYQACLKTKIESADRKRLADANKLKLGKLPPAGDIAVAMTTATEKKGASWFSTKVGCMAKVEVKSSIEGVYGHDQVVATYEWKIDLTDRGFGKVPTGGNGKDPGTKPGTDEKTK